MFDVTFGLEFRCLMAGLQVHECSIILNLLMLHFSQLLANMFTITFCGVFDATFEPAYEPAYTWVKLHSSTAAKPETPWVTDLTASLPTGEAALGG